MTSHTRRQRHYRFISLAIATVITFALASAAQADALDAAKSAGQVGEQRDGFLGLVSGDAPADVVALGKSVNAKRKDAYTAVAKKNGLAFSAVAKRGGEKWIAKTLSGNYAQNAGGGWEKK